MIPRILPIYSAICLSLLALQALAEDNNKDQALEHFNAGIGFLKDNDTERAALAFEKSIELYPTKGALFNLANSYRALNQYAKALDAFKQLRIAFATQLGEDMRTATTRMEKEIRAVVAEVAIKVGQDNATLYVDDLEVGTSPLSEPLILMPGEHKVAVFLEGYQKRERKILLRAGDKTIEIFEGLPEKELVSAPEPTAPMIAGPTDETTADSETVTKAPTHALKPIFWSGAAGTLVAGAVAAVFWGLAAQANNDLVKYNGIITSSTTDAEVPATEDYKKDITAKRDRAKDDVTSNQNWAIGLTVGAGALAVATAIVLAVDLTRKSEKQTSPVSVAPAGIVVSF